MPYNSYNAAKKMQEDLKEEITDLLDSLSDNENLEIIVGGCPANFVLDGIGYSGPDLLLFYGICGTGEVRIMQHVSQLNVCLKIVDRKNIDDPRPEIDFFDDPKVE